MRAKNRGTTTRPVAAPGLSEEAWVGFRDAEHAAEWALMQLGAFGALAGPAFEAMEEPPRRAAAGSAR